MSNIPSSIQQFIVNLQDFFCRLKPKQYKKCQYSWLFKKTAIIKQNKMTVKIFDKSRKIIDGLERLG